MANPTGFTAAFDSSNVEMAFREETAWGVLPVGTGQAIRLLGESLTETRSRTRPNEINASGQASAALTTKVEAGGSINIGYSYGTYDELLKGLLNADLTGAWSAPTTVTGQNIQAVSKTTGITLNGAANAGKYAGFIVTTGAVSSLATAGYRIGSWIRVAGFTAGDVVNNGYWRIVGIDSTGLKIAVDGPGTANITNVAAGASRTIMSSGSIRNGNNVHSYWFEKRLAPIVAGVGKHLVYPGTYVSGGSLSANLGGFLEGSLALLAKGEQIGSTTTGVAPTTGTTGAKSSFTSDTYVVAPAGRIIDSISGIQFASLGYGSTGSVWNFEDVVASGGALSAVLQGFNINFTKNNARQQFGVGDVNAKGIGKGTIQADGKMQMYFKDFTMYSFYKSEQSVVASFRIQDATGNSYIITMPAVTLMNPNIVAGGPDTDMVADFTLEGNPGYTLPTLSGYVPQVVGTEAETGPYTIQIDRFVAA